MKYITITTFQNQGVIFKSIQFKYKKGPNIFKYFTKILFKYIITINISVSRSDVMPAKLIIFNVTSPNSANYSWRNLTSGLLHNLCLPRARGWISTWQWP